ncbi:hypothetical protein AURDEDRAFT_157819 [Auricularia subglabra TFB-10046 SS5]|nr:hypothetical protein AURDEDRAFT_157819 [Auricularia subglabra TFB-10046 SS5]
MSSDEIYSRDYNDVVKNAAQAGWQVASLAVTPFYVALTIARRGRSAVTLNSVMRAQWIGGVAGTGLGGRLRALIGEPLRVTYVDGVVRLAGTGYAWLAHRDPAAVHDLANRQRYDAARVRRNDYSMAGAVVVAALSPALFWNYGRVFDLVLGGASFGCAAGSLTHVFKAMPPRHAAPVLPPPSTPAETR